MKITLTQKSEVRPLSDDETENVPETVHDFNIYQYITISTNFQCINLIDLAGKPKKIKIIGVGAARFDLGVNKPCLLLKVVLVADTLELLPIEPIPGYLSYKVIES